MIVEELWRYPVKSLGGEQLRTVDVDEYGLVGDRRWGIVDPSTGKFLTARREPRLLLAASRFVEGGDVEITLPDGSTARTDRDLSKWLDTRVELVEAPDDGANYESPTDATDESDWYSWSGPGHALHDAPFARISIVSRDRLRAWDARRVRPNIVIASGDERTLVNHTLQIGEAVVNVVAEIKRCVMVTRPQPGLERDLSVLKTINSEHGGCFSVGALVADSGIIRRGDSLQLLES